MVSCKEAGRWIGKLSQRYNLKKLTFVLDVRGEKKKWEEKGFFLP